MVVSPGMDQGGRLEEETLHRGADSSGVGMFGAEEQLSEAHRGWAFRASGGMLEPPEGVERKGAGSQRSGRNAALLLPASYTSPLCRCFQNPCLLSWPTPHPPSLLGSSIENLSVL